MSSLRKLFLGPMNSIRCQHCGKGVSIAWRHGIWQLLVLIALLFLMRLMKLDTLSLLLIGLVVAVVLSAIQLKYVPLKRERF